MINIQTVKPQTKKSDKYSYQLYNFIKKHPRCDKVYYIASHENYDVEADKVTYDEVPFDESKINPYYIWIGHKNEDESYEDGKIVNWYSGNNLYTILGCGKCKYTEFANPWLTGKHVVEITDWFWDNYSKLGRCLWDGSHQRFMTNEEERYTYIDDNTRKCNWCGKTFEKHEVPVTTIKTEWVEKE